jgi:hypothetical protein
MRQGVELSQQMAEVQLGTYAKPLATDQQVSVYMAESVDQQQQQQHMYHQFGGAVALPYMQSYDGAEYFDPPQHELTLHVLNSYIGRYVWWAGWAGVMRPSASLI